MTKFRPCIDLHCGEVKQIVGGTLSTDISQLRINHVSSLSASHFAHLYKQHALAGAHVIMLGPGNEQVATEALEAWPSALQIGGGINEENSQLWIDRGAEKVTTPLSDMISGAENLLKGHCHFVPVSRRQVLHEAPYWHSKIPS